MKHFLLIGLLFAAQFSFAGVGRIGNRDTDFISNKKSFGVNFPQKFNFDKLVQEGFRLQGPPTFQFSTNFFGVIQTLKAQNIDLSEFATKYVELKSMSQAQLEEWFQKNQWQRLNLLDHCNLVYSIQNANLVTTVVIWAPGQGYVLVADNTPETKTAIKELIQSTEIYKDECAWK